MPLLLRAILQVARSWRAILALAGLVLATGFSAKMFVHELAQSAVRFWWIVGLACLVVLIREIIRGYFDLKKEEMKQVRK